MINKKHRVFLYCLLLFVGSKMAMLNAQSLDTLLVQAERQHLGIKILDQEYRAALEKVAQSRQIPHTQLGFGAFALPVQTRVGPQRMRLGIMQALPWFGTLNAQEAIAQAKAKPFLAEKQILNLQILHQLKGAYFRLYHHAESQQILQKNVEILERLRQLSLRKVEGGKASTSDVLRLEIKLREFRKQVEILAEQRLQPQAEINQLLNRDPLTSIQILDTLNFASLPSSLIQEFQDSWEQHPAIVSLAYHQEIAQKELLLTEKRAKPTWSIGMDYLMVDPLEDSFSPNNGRDVVQIKASLNIPFQQKPYKARKEEERIRIQTLNLKKENLQTQFQAYVQQAMAKYKSAQLKYDLYEDQINSTQSVIQLLQSDYSNNGESFDELLSLEQDLLGYELKKLEAIIESHQAKADIEQIIKR